ncbi:MAG: hypothetical protein ACO1OC_06620 [Tuberibacillus sp.]
MDRPMSLGDIINLTFRIIIKRFWVLLILLLILTGPNDLINLFETAYNGAPFFGSASDAKGIIGAILNNITGKDPSVDFQLADFNATTIILIAIGLLLTVALGSMARASILASIYHERNGETVNVKKALKQSYSRFWPLLGSSIIYGLCVLGILIGLMAILALSHVIGDIVLILIIPFAIFSLYLIIRWCFYYPAVLFEKVAPGLRKSWQLTDESFWRLLGIFIVFNLITLIFNSVVSGVFDHLFGYSVLTEFVSDIVSILTDMITYVSFALIYFDLRVRNDGE